MSRTHREWRAVALAALLLSLEAPGRASSQGAAGPDFLVTTTADGGEGSLRHAIGRANAAPGRHVIRFDSTRGPFANPQTIVLKGELPPLRGEITVDGYIEGRLWVPTGVTLSGGNKRRVLHVAPGAHVHVSSLTVSNGSAEQGGGLLNEGTLTVKGVTFVGNTAARDGGSLASLGGALTVVNSTFADNRAGEAGGGLAVLGGKATVTNCTFSGNRARRGGGLFTREALLLRNTLLANSGAGGDCAASGKLDSRSTHNLIVANDGCGTPFISADPRLEKLGAYNGPTPTIPLGGGSKAINMGDNASAVDEDGRPLMWDQRGNGDPRFVAGYVDIGAFEVQAFPVLKVNTADDTALRACSGVGMFDCSLRGAIELANAANEPQVITFDPQVFAKVRSIKLATPLPATAVDVTLDAGASAAIVIRSPAPLDAAKGHRLRLKGVKVETTAR